MSIRSGFSSFASLFILFVLTFVLGYVMVCEVQLLLGPALSGVVFILRRPTLGFVFYEEQECRLVIYAKTVSGAVLEYVTGGGRV